MRKDVMIVVVMCCFLKLPTGFIPWAVRIKVGEINFGDMNLWFVISQNACHYNEQFR